MNELRGLSVRQPFAWAICSNLKTIENRTWTTDRRGTIAIHASTSPQYVNELRRELNPGELSKDYFTYGAVIGLVDIEDITSYGRQHEADPFASGPYCWRVSNGRFLKQPIAMKGKLNLFKMPTPLQRQILAAETYELNVTQDATAAILADVMNGDPDPVGNYLALFDECLHTRNHMEATKVAVDRLMELAPNHPDALVAKACAELDDTPEAACPIAQRAVEIDPDFAFGWIVLAFAYKKCGKWPEALAAASRSLQLEDDNSSMLEVIAEAHWQLGNPEDAQATCERALRQEPESNSAKQLLQTIKAGR
ncbi:Tetratricopeptide repeat protein [Novipirellula galeiformis]|uniref:Tetratricopeptide repeat protein n=1 Tax=Novipirellula galeiformis TaxID=2528004 RepID=A0A5C6CNN0_9BACT|nr:tetratricopeptide repeat protein [Novipirellula galeiformis]TWU25074.1 Tetratricopeptide repeat protein [Novipirellula galeiformis]